MLRSFAQLLDDARSRRAAVGAFTCYNLETAAAALEAAAARRAGAILLLSAQSFRATSGDMLAAALVAAAQQATAPACVQLDHADDLELMERAFSLGVQAVMADGSRRSWEDNVRLVSDAVTLATAHGGQVEAELGGISGDEDVAKAVAAGALTEPAEAAEFVQRTGASCLAVSIGNVHGIYKDPPQLDWERLTAVRDRVACALSLHGASGIPEDQVRNAISLGVAKVNVNTELRMAYLSATADGIEDVRDGARLLALSTAQAAAVRKVVEAKISAYESPS